MEEGQKRQSKQTNKKGRRWEAVYYCGCFPQPLTTMSSNHLAQHFYSQSSLFYNHRPKGYVSPLPSGVAGWILSNGLTAFVWSNHTYASN